MRSLIALSSFSLAIALAGCASGGAFGPGTASAASSIQGTVHGGLGPVVGAHVYLMKTATSGYGQAAQSLLVATDTHYSDDLGAYVMSDSAGNFQMPSSYNCSSSDQVYLYATGGNAGAGANSAAGLMSAIGSCPLLEFDGLQTFAINEITTVGTAYALGGFATDPTHVATSGSALAQTDLQNAFANAQNLYSAAGGSILQTTPGGNGVVPWQEINTIANILAACVQSSGPTSAPCTTLFANSRSSSGVLPATTAEAMMNIVHNPGANVPALYAIAVAANNPYGPSLAVRPNDFTLGITFTGGGLSGPYAVAIDSEGNPWFANLGDSSVTKLTPTGMPLSPSNGYVNGSPVGPVGITIDLSGNAWIVNAVSSSLIKYASSGALLSPSTGFNGGGLQVPEGIASDALGNVWVTNYVGSASKFSTGGLAVSGGGYTGGGIQGAAGLAIDASGSIWVANSHGSPAALTKFSSVGQPLSPSIGFTGGGLNRPVSVAVDQAGSVWAANFAGNSLSKLDINGNPLSPSTGFTGGGLNLPFNVAVDGAGNVWVANFGAYSVSEFNNAGTPLSSSTGYTGGMLNGPQALAVDGSGNVWVANSNDVTVTELLGVSVPTITPLVQGVKNNTIASRP